MKKSGFFFLFLFLIKTVNRHLFVFYASETDDAPSLSIACVSSGSSRTSDSNLSSFCTCNTLCSMFTCFFGGFTFNRRFGDNFNDVTVPLRILGTFKINHPKWKTKIVNITHLSSPTMINGIF